jgi:hypothetical protein
MRNAYIALFVASAVITLVVITTVSLCYAVPCATGSQVCDFVIDATHRCKNGVGTNSIMPNENTTKNYVETGKSCGMEWYVGGFVTYPTLETCGTAVSPDCS